MIDVTLQFNEYDLSDKLSTYAVSHEVETFESVTTLDGTEHTATRIRPTIRFALVPLSDDDAAEVYDALKVITAEAYYTDPNTGGERYGTMRLTSNLEAVFGLRSVDGNRYYKGGTLTMRQRNVL